MDEEEEQSRMEDDVQEKQTPEQTPWNKKLLIEIGIVMLVIVVVGGYFLTTKNGEDEAGADCLPGQENCVDMLVGGEVPSDNEIGVSPTEGSPPNEGSPDEEIPIQTQTPDTENIESILIQTASELNEQLPRMVDSETRLDSTISVGNQFIYKYTLINFLLEEIDVEVLRDKLLVDSIFINEVCISPDTDMKVFRDNETTIRFFYYDGEGAFVLDITVETRDCFNRTL